MTTNIWTLIPAVIAICLSTRPAGGADPLRIDLQVYTAQELPIAGLQLADFAVSANDQLQAVKQFKPETMPLDVLFLLDVSRPMKPYVTFLHDQSEAALKHGLTDKDRVAIMAFDVNAKIVLPFTSNQANVTDALGFEARSEQFNGAARITSALISASAYLQRHARTDARRAIIVLTGNTTEDGADEQRVLDALQRADATLGFLFPYERKDVDEDGDPIAPTADKKKRRWPTQDPAPPQLKHSAPATAPHEAGAGLIAQDSGGDGSVFEDEYALTEMLRHLGRRYSLLVDSGPTLPERLMADLTSDARSRYPTAVVHFRVLYHAGHGQEELMVPMNLTPEDQNKKRKAVNEQPNF